MNESVLQTLMKVFALVASVDEKGLSQNERDVIVEYLGRQFSQELVAVYLAYFDRYLLEYHPKKSTKEDKDLSREHLKSLEIIGDLCENLNKELEQPQKALIIIHLLDFINRGEQITQNELELVTTVADKLHFPKEEFNEAQAFTFNKLNESGNKKNLLYIDGKQAPVNKEIKHIYIKKIEGRITILHINSTNTYVMRYEGPQVLLLNGHNIKTNRSYIWAPGSVIKNPHFGSVYYTWIAGKYIQAASESNFIFRARNIEFAYGHSPNGIKRFNLNEESGRLIGIIGGSGSGKSTLLKVLSGVIKPGKGSICINNFDIHKNKSTLRGIIGYVPQEDFLIKELTVFENLYYSAKLSFSTYNQTEIEKVVEKALLSFDLVEARNLQVGDELNTFLSGGQRKRLNIALELIREPSVLFVDEPTSGLSSADSEKVMNLLKRQTFKGKLVFANIHQPSSEIFKLLDKLLVVDQGGRVIYYGNPVDSIGYFKRISHYVDAEESECLTCGNINAEQILRNVEARIVDVNGRLTRKRKIKPREWYDFYMDQIDPIIRRIRRPFSSSVPESKYRIPPRKKQLNIFFKRDVLAKLKNTQYLVITMLEAPVLALLLAVYTRSSRDSSGMPTDYSFGLNANIPAYLFMAVIVALFLGLVLSAEEIFRDRKILERERFLSLSRWSYLSSKISILFIISAIQMFLFVLIGNYILEIKSMSWRYFLILFSTSCWANLVGLNISSGFKSVVTIYILVPLILVPQLLFSGVVVDFHNLNRVIASGKYVPVVGDAMTSRWAYESLVVSQFKDNPFNKKIFPYEQRMNASMYKKAYIIPKLQNTLEEMKRGIQEPGLRDTLIDGFKLLRNEISKLNEGLNLSMPAFLFRLDPQHFTEEIYRITGDHLNTLWKRYHTEYLNAVADKERILITDYSKYMESADKLVAMKKKYHNRQIEGLVKNDNEMVEFMIIENEIIRLRNPVYTLPASNVGRAHFYAPYKNIGGWLIDTFWFNILAIWIYTGLWFVVLYYDLLRKLIKYIDNLKLQRFNQRILRIRKQVEVRQ